jgi:hypothetical protein
MTATLCRTCEFWNNANGLPTCRHSYIVGLVHTGQLKTYPLRAADDTCPGHSDRHERLSEEVDRLVSELDRLSRQISTPSTAALARAAQLAYLDRLGFPTE